MPYNIIARLALYSRITVAACAACAVPPELGLVLYVGIEGVSSLDGVESGGLKCQ